MCLHVELDYVHSRLVLYLVGLMHLGVVVHPVHRFLLVLDHRSLQLLGVTLSLFGSFLPEVPPPEIDFFLDPLFSVFYPLVLLCLL